MALFSNKLNWVESVSCFFLKQYVQNVCKLRDTQRRPNCRTEISLDQVKTNGFIKRPNSTGSRWLTWGCAAGVEILRSWRDDRTSDGLTQPHGRRQSIRIREWKERSESPTRRFIRLRQRVTPAGVERLNQLQAGDLIRHHRRRGTHCQPCEAISLDSVTVHASAIKNTTKGNTATNPQWQTNKSFPPTLHKVTVWPEQNSITSAVQHENNPVCVCHRATLIYKYRYYRHAARLYL